MNAIANCNCRLVDVIITPILINSWMLGRSCPTKALKVKSSILVYNSHHFPYKQKNNRCTGCSKVPSWTGNDCIINLIKIWNKCFSPLSIPFHTHRHQSSIVLPPLAILYIFSPPRKTSSKCRVTDETRSFSFHGVVDDFVSV